MSDNMIARMARLAATTMEVRGGQSGDGHSELIAAADEIERIERELAEEKRVSSMRLERMNYATDEHAKLMVRNADLEAQCAAMRAALEEFVRKVEAGEARSTRSYKQMKAALSPDAGAKVLRVVALMKKLIEAIDNNALEMNSPEVGGEGDIPPHRWHEEWIYHTRQTLAALEGRKS